MTPKLSEGVLQVIKSGGEVQEPILQILGNKKIASAGASDRYRLLISDGQHLDSFAMLATQLNDKVTSGELENYTVVRVNRLVTSMVNNAGKGHRRVIIILDLDVVSPGSEVGLKIGNPIPLQVDSGSSDDGKSSSSAGRPAEPVANGFNKGRPMNRNTGPPPISPMNRSTGIMSPMNRNTGPPTPMSPMDIVKTHPISSLSPYQNKWVIKARVTNKTPIKTWSNSRGEGKLFSMDLVDETAEIRVTAFNNECERFFDMIEVGKVYFLSKCTLKTANKNYTSIKNDYEMTFTSDTQVIPCHENTSEVPGVTFNFVPIPQLQDMAANAIVDIIGVCKSYSDVQSLVARTTNRELKKREIQLVDSTNTEVSLTLWGTQAEEFDGTRQPVVAVRNARVSEYGGGKSVSLLMSSLMQIDPDVPEAHRLRGWFDNEGSTQETQNISLRTGAGGSGMSSAWKSFAEAKQEQLGSGEKADYFTSKATVVLIKKENSLYQACPTPECNKKVIDMNTGLYRCEKCNKEFPNFKWRILLTANLGDFTDNNWVTCFQESAEQMLGVSAEDLGDARVDDEKFANIFNEATFKSFIFRLRVKMEQYNDESRLKSTIVQVSPLNFNDYNRRLIQEIKEMTRT